MVMLMDSISGYCLSDMRQQRGSSRRRDPIHPHLHYTRHGLVWRARVQDFCLGNILRRLPSSSSAAMTLRHRLRSVADCPLSVVAWQSGRDRARTKTGHLRLGSVSLPQFYVTFHHHQQAMRVVVKAAPVCSGDLASWPPAARNNGPMRRTASGGCRARTQCSGQGG